MYPADWYLLQLEKLLLSHSHLSVDLSTGMQCRYSKNENLHSCKIKTNGSTAWFKKQLITLLQFFFKLYFQIAGLFSQSYLIFTIYNTYHMPPDKGEQVHPHCQHQRKLPTDKNSKVQQTSIWKVSKQGHSIIIYLFINKYCFQILVI